MKTCHLVPLAALLLAGCSNDAHRVATLSAATPGGPTNEGDSTLTSRRMWVPPASAGLIAISHDGRMALTATGGALELRDIAADTVRKLTSSDNSWLNAATFGRTDREILYVLSVSKPTWEERELRLRNLDTGGDQLLRRFPGRHAWVQFGAVTPVGRHVVLGLRDGEWAWQLAIVSIADGSVKSLKSLKWRSPGGIRLSADGRFIAYDLPSSERTSKRDLFVMAIDGSREAQITRTRESERLVDWSPDGASLLFMRDEGGSRNLWRVPVSDGVRAGDDQLVRRDVTGMSPYGFAGERLYYAVVNRTREFRTTLVDVVSGMAGPTTGLFHVSDYAAWDVSPNGATIAYFVGGDDDGNGPISLFVRDLATGDVREIELPLDYIWNLRWTDDPQVLLGLAQRRGRDDVYRIDLRTGATQLIPNALAPCGGEPFRLFPLFASDGRETFYLRANNANPPTELVACPGAGGPGRVLFNGTALGPSYQFTPDEKGVVVMDRRGDSTVVLRIPTAGGRPVALYQSTGADRIDGLAGWTADGSAFLASRAGREGGRQLVRVTLDGTIPTAIVAEFPARTAGFRLSPDQRKVFSVLRQGAPAELWVMEGFASQNLKRAGAGR